LQGETEELGENLPQRHFVPPQIPHDQVRFRTPDRSGGKPATNRLSYGAALLGLLFDFEDGGDIFPRNVTEFQMNCTVLKPENHTS
jgi:hypothetical protein